MSKNILLSIVLLIVVGLLAACGGDTAPAPADAPAVQEPAAVEEPTVAEPEIKAAEDIKIGMSVLNLANPFFVALAAGAQGEADKLGVELVINDPKDDVNTQVTQIENFINAGFDGFVVTAVDPAAIGPLTKDALDSGMFVVAHTSDLGEENQTALVWAVEHDMGVTLGRQAGEWATTHIPDGETLTLAILNYDIIPQVIQRREGIVDGIAEVFGDNYEVVGTVTAGDPISGAEAAENWLQAHPDLDMIVGINDGGALGAYQAVIAADKDNPDTFYVGGIDATDEALAAIMDGGSYQATVDQQPSEMGALTVRTLVKAIQGEEVEAISAIKLAPVNASNVENFMGDSGEATTEGEPETEGGAMTGDTDTIKAALDEQGLSDIKVGMSVLNLANPFFVALAAGAQDEADALGVEIVINDPKDDVNNQVTQIENFINAGFDGFVVTAVDPAAIGPLAKDALDSGMHVVAHTSDLGEENQTALVWAIEHDMGVTLGRQAGEWAKTHVPAGETLKLAILNYDIIPQVIQRREGIVDGIAEVFGDNYEVVGTVTAGDPISGSEAAETWLQAHPDLNMIVGINDGGALGAYQAVIAADKDDPETFFVGGIDATDEALAAIMEGGSYLATVDQQPYEMGALTVRALVSAIAGLPVDAISAIKLAPVNASNVADFMN